MQWKARCATPTKMKIIFQLTQELNLPTTFPIRKMKNQALAEAAVVKRNKKDSQPPKYIGYTNLYDIHGNVCFEGLRYFGQLAL